MDNKEIVSFVKKQLSEWALEDVKRASDGKSKMGAFILSSCLIDYLANFYSKKTGQGKRYQDFCIKYLPQYNAKDL